MTKLLLVIRMLIIILVVNAQIGEIDLKIKEVKARIESYRIAQQFFIDAKNELYIMYTIKKITFFKYKVYNKLCAFYINIYGDLLQQFCVRYKELLKIKKELQKKLNKNS